MIYVSIENGKLSFTSTGGPLHEPEMLGSFAPDAWQDVVHFLRNGLRNGWDGKLCNAPNIDFSREEGWPDDFARNFINNCYREAVEYVPVDEISTLRETLRITVAERDALSRELAELEHTHEQLCIAAVTLSDERDDLRKHLAAAQKDLLRALSDAAPILSRSAADAPLGPVQMPTTEAEAHNGFEEDKPLGADDEARMQAIERGDPQAVAAMDTAAMMRTGVSDILFESCDGSVTATLRAPTGEEIKKVEQAVERGRQETEADNTRLEEMRNEQRRQEEEYDDRIQELGDNERADAEELRKLNARIAAENAEGSSRPEELIKNPPDSSPALVPLIQGDSSTDEAVEAYMSMKKTGAAEEPPKVSPNDDQPEPATTPKSKKHKKRGR